VPKTTMDEKESQIENRLKDLRKKSHLSQEELADKLGISRQSVIALEQGKYMPSLPLAVSLCQFFNSAFEEMFDFEREVEESISEVLDNSNIKINVINPADRQERKEKPMVELEPWRPFREAVSLRDAMDRLFEDSVITPAKISGGLPRIDLKETKDSVVVKAELPGVDEEDISVEVMDNVMTISGEKKEEKQDEGKGYYYKESHTGTFSRSFTLPSEVVADKAVAEMKNGVLTISVPKVAPKLAKKITLKKNK